ncbi:MULTISPECIES: hypothetical protein, partial [unclassified Mesorhizobium]|uniref:hypothetical protein n=1 Tax=unclassified Mesorhizobium TaxID=325217 RepID=UPI001AEEE07E
PSLYAKSGHFRESQAVTLFLTKASPLADDLYNSAVLAVALSRYHQYSVRRLSWFAVCQAEELRQRAVDL